MNRTLVLLILLGLAGGYRWWKTSAQEPSAATADSPGVETSSVLPAWLGGKREDSSRHTASGETSDVATAARAGGTSGFVQAAMPSGYQRGTVLILAAPNCPSEQSQRAESLASSLATAGVRVVRGSEMNFDVESPSQETMAGIQRAVDVFNQGAPAVFVNGYAASNPSAADVRQLLR